MSRHLILAGSLLATPALADEPNFAPDRPGVGESGGTPGPGFVTIEGGLSMPIVDGKVSPGTSGLTFRLGVDQDFEVRATLPDIVLQDGQVELGAFGIGMKIAGRQGERFSVSAVPTLLIGLDGTAGYQVSVNGGLTEGHFGLWLNATSTVLGRDVSVQGGGGALVGFDVGGLYVNAGYEAVSMASFVGGGGWWVMAPNAQLDAGIDVWMIGSDAVIVPMIGTSHAF